MNDDDDTYIAESNESRDAAWAVVERRAVERWGAGNFKLIVSDTASADLTTGNKLLYTVVASKKAADN